MGGTVSSKPSVPILSAEQAVEVRRLQYEFFRDHFKHVVAMQGAMGRWLLASLLLVHGGVFAFLAQSEHLSAMVLPRVYWWLLAGLVLALVSGFSTWWNWTLATPVYASVSPAMIYDATQTPTFTKEQLRGVRWAMVAALSTGVLSLLCLIGAALVSADLLSATPVGP